MKKFFALEKKRQNLANENNLVELKKLYSNQLPQLPDLNSSKLWDKLNNQHNSSPSFSPMEYDKLQKAAALIKGADISVLNIGFGSCNLEQQFFHSSRKKVTWEGIDISKESVKKARLKFPKASFNVGNILNLTYNSESFDYVVALEVLEHIQPNYILSVLASIRKILKRNGTLIISIPVNEGLEEMISRGINPNAHVRDYSAELIRAELLLTGFHQIQVKTFYAFSSKYYLKTVVAHLIPNIKHINGVLISAKS